MCIRDRHIHARVEFDEAIHGRRIGAKARGIQMAGAMPAVRTLFLSDIHLGTRA